MNPRLLRALLVAGFAFATFVVFEIYRAGLNEIPPPPNTTNIVARYGGTAAGERISSKSWTLRYDRMVASGDQTIVDLFGVHDGTIFKAGKPYLSVRAAHLTVNTISHDFTANGPLHVATIGAKPPRSFDTNYASWSDALQRLLCEHKTIIATGADTPMTVSRMELDVKTGDVDLSDASGSVRLK